jgi:hypothetical protein
MIPVSIPLPNSGTGTGTGTGTGSDGTNILISSSASGSVFVVAYGNKIFFYSKIYYNHINSNVITLLQTINIDNGTINAISLSSSGNVLIVCCNNLVSIINLTYYVSNSSTIPLLTYGSVDHIVTIDLLNYISSSNFNSFDSVKCYIGSNDNEFVIGSSLVGIDSTRILYGIVSVFAKNGNWLNILNFNGNFYLRQIGKCMALNYINDRVLLVGSSLGIGVYNNTSSSFVNILLEGADIQDLYWTQNSNYLICIYNGAGEGGFTVFSYNHPTFTRLNSLRILSTSGGTLTKVHITEDGSKVAVLNPYFGNTGNVRIYSAIYNGNTIISYHLAQTLNFPSSSNFNGGADSSLSFNNLFTTSKLTNTISIYDLISNSNVIEETIYTSNINSPLTIVMHNVQNNKVFISSSFDGVVFIVGYGNTISFYSMIFSMFINRYEMNLLTTINCNTITSMHLSSGGHLLVVCCGSSIIVYNLTYYIPPQTSRDLPTGMVNKIYNIDLLNIFPTSSYEQYIDINVFIDFTETSFAVGLPNFNSFGRTCIFELNNSDWTLNNTIYETTNSKQGKSLSLNMENKFLVVGGDSGIYIYKYTTSGFVLNQQLLEGVYIYDLYLTLNANYLVCSTDSENNGTFYVFQIQYNDIFHFYNYNAITAKGSNNSLTIKSKIQITENGAHVIVLDNIYNDNNGAIGIFSPNNNGALEEWSLRQTLIFPFGMNSIYGSSSSLTFYNIIAVSTRSNSILIYDSDNLNRYGTWFVNGGKGTDTSTQKNPYIIDPSVSKVGFSVQLDNIGSKAVIGMPSYNNNRGGVIIMNNSTPFTQSSNSTGWAFDEFLCDTSEEAKGSQQGYSISSIATDLYISGSVIIVGAPYYKGCGGAYVYVKNYSGAWRQQGPVLTNNIPNSMFGCSVSIDISGNNLAVGAYGLDNYSGATYVYIRLNSVWTLTQKISDILQDGIMQGFSVSMGSYNDLLLIGSPGYTKANNGTEGVANTGAAFLYYKESGVWVKRFVFKDSLPAANGSQQGYSVSISTYPSFDYNPLTPYILAIGAPNYNNGRGAIYLYQLELAEINGDSNKWIRLYPIITDSSDYAIGANLGYSVSATLGNTAGLIMASGARNYNTNQGAVYFYKGRYDKIIDGTNYYDIFTYTKYLKAFSKNPVLIPNRTGNFGNSVAINNNGGYMLVGAPNLNGRGSVIAYWTDGSGNEWYEDIGFKRALDNILGITSMAGSNTYNSQILTGNGSSTSFEPNGQIFVDIDLSSMTETGDTLFVNVQSKKTRTTIPLELYYISDD